MRSLTKLQWCSVLCILLGMAVFGGQAVAQLETYGYTYHFTPDDVGIWDISGTYTHDTLGCPTGYTLTQDAAGRLRGQGMLDCDVNGLTIAAPFTITGTIRQTRGTPRVAMTIRFVGFASDGNDVFRVRGSEKIKADVDPNTSMITGTVRTTLVVDSNTLRETVAYDVNLPADMNGVSDLTIDLTRGGDDLVGTSQLTLSNGETIQFVNSGDVSVTRNVDRLALSSVDRQKLRLTINRATGEITLLTGKVLGQNLRARNLAGTITP